MSEISMQPLPPASCWNETLPVVCPTVFGFSPNIDGVAQWQFGGYVDTFNPNFSGALYAEPDTKRPGTTEGANYAAGHPGIGFDASKSNSVYSGSVLQVNALQAIVCIKI